MQKVIIILGLFLVLGMGCSTTGFLGLAKESYVKQIENENAELKKELEEENAELKEEMEAIKADMRKVLKLAKEIEELQEMTRDIETQLDDMPEDTLRELIKVLEKYLDEDEIDERSDIKNEVDEIMEEID